MIDYEKTLFLTFDVDWACDGVLEDTIDILESENVAATFFVTHDTPLLNRLREKKLFELGIHPNFNPLLDGGAIRNSDDILRNLKEIVPEATSIRCHSLVQSSRLLEKFVEYGLTHDVNTFIPDYSNIHIKAFQMYNGITRAPYTWEDCFHCLAHENPLGKDWEVNRIFQQSGLKIINFHPIHVFLNTNNWDLYESTRMLHREPLQLIKHRHSGEGARKFLCDLVRTARAKGFKFALIKEIKV